LNTSLDALTLYFRSIDSKKYDGVEEVTVLSTNLPSGNASIGNKRGSIVGSAASVVDAGFP
jgi:hypothetical protein